MIGEPDVTKFKPGSYYISKYSERVTYNHNVRNYSVT